MIPISKQLLVTSAENERGRYSNSRAEEFNSKVQEARSSLSKANHNYSIDSGHDQTSKNGTYFLQLTKLHKQRQL